MKRHLVWDLPVRLFHWLLVATFGAAFIIGQTTDDDGAVFALHMVAGLVAAFLVALRLVWGVAGTRHARFRAFACGPRVLAGYLRDAIVGRAQKFAGHNPGTIYAAIAMFLLILGLAVTGVATSRGSHTAEEIHEALAWAMVAVVGLHVAGVAWHTIRHRENITLGMIDGRKAVEPTEAITSARRGSAVVLLVLTAVWAGSLLRGYDGGTGALTAPVLGTLHAGEEEHEGGDGHDEGRRRGDDEDDDD